MITDYTPESAAAAGAALLDAKRPGWADDLGLALDMSDCQRCVLGQMFTVDENENGFQIGMADLFPDLAGTDHETFLAAASAFGFEIPSDSRYTYSDLEKAWLPLIAARRNDGTDEGAGAR